ncbi:MAG: DUF3386 domain-containing protein [Richelia sp. RM2_1_2]|nr:DUF3386 domain-containing protein [Richelia sp. SM2_1_7]NJM19440.1 DUF3386 domain-containing protein [Richelia sp. SM1_7_0]NJN10721.1 DUF3386 domain-containing protein [Richelia sp. RM1_1_1]NJO27642.1 DUF3386 domain-containing protein [Richelia sp. SL_2_1]NJO59245.1 DUF3386 domain-containing protein [Richelia sp. RM2_1_2]
MKTSKTAQDLFQIAYENRYTWDEDFPGYSAKVQLIQGEETYTGKIFVNRDLSVEVSGISDIQVQEGIYIQLRNVVTQCKITPFHEEHQEHEFIQDATDDTQAVVIIVKGESLDSTYKIRGKEICQVTRIKGNTAFVIDTHENFDTGEGYIANRYDVIFRDVQTEEIQSILKFEDIYEKVGKYYLMTKQVVQDSQDGKDTTTEFSYFDIKLG